MDLGLLDAAVLITGGGRIICIGGTSARAVSRDGPGPATRSELAQGLGNGALANFVRHLAEELARDRILVNVIHPSQTRTDRYPARVAGSPQNGASAPKRRRPRSRPAFRSAA